MPLLKHCFSDLLRRSKIISRIVLQELSLLRCDEFSTSLNMISLWNKHKLKGLVTSSTVRRKLVLACLGTKCAYVTTHAPSTTTVLLITRSYKNDDLSHFDHLRAIKKKETEKWNFYQFWQLQLQPGMRKKTFSRFSRFHVFPKFENFQFALLFMVNG